MGGDVDISTHHSCFQLRCPVAPVAQPRQRRIQVGQKEDNRAGVGSQGLLETQVAGLGPELTPLQDLQLAAWFSLFPGLAVSARLPALHRVDAQTRLAPAGPRTGGCGSRGVRPGVKKLLFRYRICGESAGRTPLDDRLAQWLGRDRGCADIFEPM